MAKVLVLYYSSYGHIERMAVAVSEGVRDASAEVELKRVPETVPQKITGTHGFRVNEAHPVAEPDDLADYDAIIVGTPTHYGNISSQMTSFWARTGELWKKGALIGQIGGAFSSTDSQHGGNEAAILSMHRTLLHHGLILVGLLYSFQGQLEGGAETGGSPYSYSATTIADNDMSRQPSVVELNGAKFQGKQAATAARSLFG
jgi:NAD(P)H dehydrogenase (quinone)